MSVLFCCCVSPSEDNDERQPLLHTKPSKSAKPESARQPRPAPTEDSWCVNMVMKGYDFSLSVVPLRSTAKGEESPPSRLRLAQEELWGISQGAKAISAAGTKLQELIGWLLNGGERMAEQVREAAPTHQDRCRLEENLIETMQEVRRARELSLGYRQQAGEVQTEAAQIAGLA
ncbi:uncharacterized protein si:ch73-345f18.3 [Salvelinus fontinalis]|uniref:uncharacterized protein si:ch73-345f18.3 n=1 Tax=Salvelinus fontinalis TaxID=8038 RepID=UPI0024856D1D|nr:uncharacterized protein si:ch73-345f18.3 [Salvelinus fontinalis]